MSPTCSKAAMRALISIMLATSIANAAALPHEVLDARDASPVQNAQLAADAIQAAANAAATNPTNFFEDISDELNNRTAWEVFRDFFTRLFGPRDDDDDGSAPAVTITVTPTPANPTSPVSSAIEIIIPAGPSATPTPVVVSLYPSTTPAPSSEADIIMSILPVGDMSSAINASFLTPIFVTESETASAAIETSAPFPVFNSTTGYGGPVPTAANITGWFSTNPLVTGVPVPVNSSLPAGTGIALPIETTLPVINVTIPVINITVPIINVTAPVAENATSTTVVVLTSTVYPVPIVGTGTVPSVSAGTGIPIVVVGTPLWPNATYGEPTASVAPVGTGSSAPLGTAISAPLGTGATAVLPIETVISNGTGIPYGTGYGTAYGTGATYGTGSIPVAPLATGTGSLPAGTDLPIAASPLYPNTTYASGPSGAVYPSAPLLVTAVPLPSPINVTFPEVTPIALPSPINVTFPDANVSTTAEAVEGSVTFVPITVTGVPGSSVAITVAIPAAPYANATAVESAVLPIETTEAPVSVGTGLPVSSYTSDVAAPYANTTSIIVTETETATASAIVILPIETPEVVDAGLLSLRNLCENTPDVHTLTLPLISRFYGPAAYPALFPFPGCTVPNSRQAIQAPGLLDCSALGVQVQHCQALGKRVLLSVKASGLASVGGNTNFGDPNAPTEPFGAEFGDEGLDKRQISNFLKPILPNANLNLGHGPVVVASPSATSSKPAVGEPLNVGVNLGPLASLGVSVGQPGVVVDVNSPVKVSISLGLGFPAVTGKPVSSASKAVSSASSSKPASSVSVSKAGSSVSSASIPISSFSTSTSVSGVSSVGPVSSASEPVASASVDAVSSISVSNPISTVSVVEAIESASSVEASSNVESVSSVTATESISSIAAESTSSIVAESISSIVAESISSIAAAAASSISTAESISSTAAAESPSTASAILSTSTISVSEPAVSPSAASPSPSPSADESPSSAEAISPPNPTSSPIFNRPIVIANPSAILVAEVNPLPTASPTFPILSTASASPFPNLFSPSHPPSSFALTLFSLFGEGHTERADLRPLGPTPPSGASPNGTAWINPILTALQRPLGEEVVVDGFDVQIPAEWKGTYQDGQFADLVSRLRELHDESWRESGGVVGGKDDLGADGKGVVYSGWIGGALRTRSPGLTVVADAHRKGWVEWNPMADM